MSREDAAKRSAEPNLAARAKSVSPMLYLVCCHDASSVCGDAEAADGVSLNDGRSEEETLKASSSLVLPLPANEGDT